MKRYDPIKSAKKAKRDAFFEKGGTARSWSGGGKVFSDKKKQASKDGCRGRVRNIDD